MRIYVVLKVIVDYDENYQTKEVLKPMSYHETRIGAAKFRDYLVRKEAKSYNKIIKEYKDKAEGKILHKGLKFERKGSLQLMERFKECKDLASKNLMEVSAGGGTTVYRKQFLVKSIRLNP